MANYNVEISYFNGSSYDILYPSFSGQIIGEQQRYTGIGGTNALELSLKIDTINKFYYNFFIMISSVTNGDTLFAVGIKGNSGIMPSIMIDINNNKIYHYIINMSDTSTSTWTAKLSINQKDQIKNMNQICTTYDFVRLCANK